MATPFFVDVQDAYLATGEVGSQPPRPEDVDDDPAELRDSPRFGDVSVRRYLWACTYTADEYLAGLDTYSGHRAMSADARAALYADIRLRIEARPGQRVRKHYLFTLQVARRA